jgi:hypothetical protein
MRVRGSSRTSRHESKRDWSECKWRNARKNGSQAEQAQPCRGVMSVVHDAVKQVINCRAYDMIFRKFMGGQADVTSLRIAKH